MIGGLNPPPVVAPPPQPTMRTEIYPPARLPNEPYDWRRMFWIVMVFFALIIICDIISIIGGFFLSNIWSDYSEEEFGFECESENKFEWSPKWTLNNLGNGMFVLGIISLTMFLFVAMFHIIKCELNPLTMGFMFLTNVPHIILLSYFAVYWDFLYRINEYCKSNSNIKKDSNDIMIFLLPASLVYWISFWCYAIIVCFAGWKKG